MASVNKLLESIDRQIRDQLASYNMEKGKSKSFDFNIGEEVVNKPQPKKRVKKNAKPETDNQKS